MRSGHVKLVGTTGTGRLRLSCLAAVLVGQNCTCRSALRKIHAISNLLRPAFGAGRPRIGDLPSECGASFARQVFGAPHNHTGTEQSAQPVDSVSGAVCSRGQRMVIGVYRKGPEGSSSSSRDRTGRAVWAEAGAEDA